MPRTQSRTIDKKTDACMVIVLFISLLMIDCSVSFSAGNNDKLPEVLSAQQERIRVIEAAAKTSVSVFAGSSGGGSGVLLALMDTL